MRSCALGFPKSILIETNNICQGECLFCPYKEIRRDEKNTSLDYNKYKEMINEISLYGMQRLTLFNNNEPLTDPRIYEFIKYAHSQLPDTEITLSTNGRLLNREVVEKLKESGLTTLYISIPTTEERAYEKIMGNNPTRLFKLLNEIDDKELFKMIRIASPKTKYFDYNSLKEKFGQYTICVWDLEYKENWNIGEEFKEIADGIEYTGPCDRPLDQMTISSNGNVIICCRDWQYQNVVGNVYDNTLYEIWHSNKMKTIQQAIINQEYKNISCCQDCNMNIEFYQKSLMKKRG